MLKFRDIAIGEKFHFGIEREWPIKVGEMATVSMYGEDDAPWDIAQKVRRYDGKDFDGQTLGYEYRFDGMPISMLLVVSLQKEEKGYSFYVDTSGKYQLVKNGVPVASGTGHTLCWTVYGMLSKNISV